MSPDVLQAGTLVQFDQFVRAFCGGMLVPLALGVAAYLWICLSTRRR